MSFWELPVRTVVVAGPAGPELAADLQEAAAPGDSAAAAAAAAAVAVAAAAAAAAALPIMSVPAAVVWQR